MFYYKEVIKLIAESINFHVDTIMFKLFKNVSLACNPLYRICRVSNAKRKDVGGTWRENRYPGAACDVQSHMYSLSFAPKTDWSKRYAEAPEIFDYIQDITDQYQIKTTVSLTMRLLMYSMMKCAMYGH